jgi:ribosomal protein L37E
MKKCNWCGRENLNVYAYCQSCGRGFSEPQVSSPSAVNMKLQEFARWARGERKSG